MGLKQPFKLCYILYTACLSPAEAALAGLPATTANQLLLAWSGPVRTGCRSGPTKRAPQWLGRNRITLAACIVCTAMRTSVSQCPTCARVKTGQ